MDTFLKMREEPIADLPGDHSQDSRGEAVLAEADGRGCIELSR